MKFREHKSPMLYLALNLDIIINYKCLSVQCPEQPNKI